jgi:fibronectin-binding autotransporter adhesin
MSMKRIFALLPLLCVLASAPALAQVKISQLPTAAIPLGDEYVPVVQGGVTSAAPASAFGVPIVSATAPVTNLVTGRHWMNSSTTPYTLEIYDGFEWVPEGSLNPSTHTYGTSVFGCTSPALACLNALTGYNYAGTTGGTTGNIVGSASPSFSGTVAVQNITATGVIQASSNGTAAAPSVAVGGAGVSGIFAQNANEPCLTSGGTAAFCITSTNVILFNATAALQTGSALDNIEALGMTTGTSAIAVGRFSNNSSGPRFNLMKSRNTSVAIGGAVQAGDSLGLLQFIGDDGSTTGGIVAAQINGEALGTVSTGIVPSGLLFSTLNNAGTLTQAFELDNNQNATFAGAINAVGQQTAQGLTTTSPGWYAQLTGDSMARLRLGLNSTDVASIAFGSGSTSRDTFLERAGAANIRSGAPDAAAPVAQTYSVQNAVSGTSNAAGALWSFYDSAGTGNQPSGGFAWYTHPAGYAGSSQNAATLAMALSGAGTLTIGGSQVPTVGGANTFTAQNVFDAETIFGNSSVINGTVGIFANPVIVAPSGGTGSTANAMGVQNSANLQPGTYSGASCNTSSGAGCSFAFGVYVNSTLSGSGSTTLSDVGYNCGLNISNSFSGTANNALCYEAGDLALGTGAGGGSPPVNFYQFFGVVSSAYNGLTSGSYNFRGLDLGCSRAAAGSGETLSIMCEHIDLATGSSAGNTEYGIDATNNCPATTADCYFIHEASTAPNLFTGGIVEGSGRANEGAGTLNATTLYESDTALGTAALANTGTNGATLGYLNGNNTFSGTDNFTGTLQVGGHTVGLAGNLSTSGGFGINLTASGATVVTLPTTGTLAALGNAQTWTALQTITNSDLCLLGSSTGCTTFTSANASATNYTLTVPAATDTLADLAGTQTLTNKTISGASNTISNVSLTAGVTGTLPVANGGTNAGGASITALNNITGWLLSGLSGVNSGYLIDTTTASPAQGDTAYFNGTGWADLPAGTSGQSLQTQGASANPHWASNISGYSGTLMVTTAAGVTNYFGMQGDTPSAQTVASVVTTMMDRNGTFGAVGASGKFTCTVGTAPGTGFSDVCGIYSALIPGASAITCTIANTAVTCSDTSDTLTVAAAGLYAFYITPGAGATSTARTYESVSFASP